MTTGYDHGHAVQRSSNSATRTSAQTMEHLRKIKKISSMKDRHVNFRDR
jgi:hypothetical protein